MKGEFPLVLNLKAVPFSISKLSAMASGNHKSTEPEEVISLVTASNSGDVTRAESSASDNRSVFPLASTSVFMKMKNKIKISRYFIWFELRVIN